MKKDPIDDEIKLAMRAPVTQGIEGATAADSQKSRGADSPGPVFQLDQNGQASMSPTKLSGIDGADVYKNTNIDTGKYGKAIYSDTVEGTQPEQFDKDVQKFGQGVTDQETGISNTPVSQSLTPEQNANWEKYGTLDAPQGIGQSAAPSQYGIGGSGQPPDQNGITVIGQNGNWWDQKNNDPFAQAKQIMKKLPFGSAGDRAKRREMMDSVRALISMGNEAGNRGIAERRLDLQAQQYGIENQRFNQNQSNADRRFDLDSEKFGYDQLKGNRQYGIDAYKVLNPEQKTQFIEPQFDTLGRESSPAMTFDPSEGALSLADIPEGQVNKNLEDEEEEIKKKPVPELIKSYKTKEQLGAALASGEISRNQADVYYNLHFASK